MSTRCALSFSRIPVAVWVFFGSFLIQFLILQSIANTRYFLPESDDMKFYNDWALRIAGGQWSDGKAFYGMPGFAYALAAFYTLTGGYDHHYSPFLIGQFNAAMHALTDAIFGAIGEGDIGVHFPPSDAQWKGADSRIFLEKAVSMLHAKGGVLANADITILAEAPKIAPHIPTMKAVLVPLLHLSPDRIAVKATTTEKLGAIGRGEGIMAFATVTVRLP